jgi:hypothetical protein
MREIYSTIVRLESAGAAHEPGDHTGAGGDS